jgi:dGTPase
VTFIVEAADDIVYSVVDLEDGIKRKVLSWDQVQEQLKRKCGNNSILREAASLARRQAAGGDPSRSSRDDVHAQTFRIAAISEMAIAARMIFMKRYRQIMEGQYEEELLMDKDCEAKEFIVACKEVLREKLYTAPEILKLEIRGRRVIHDLMDLFWEAVEAVLCDGKVPGIGSYPGKLFQLISENYKVVFHEQRNARNGNPKYSGLQLVCDYIAGMTDSFACRLHGELTNG